MTQEGDLTRVLGSFKPDIVVDIAGWGMSGMDMLNPRCLTVNVLGTQRLINACIHNNINRLIYTSTYNVVFCGKEIDGGDESQPYAEDTDHLDQYSKSKTKAEQLARQANGTLLSNGNRLITSVIRPAAIYGENEQRHLPRILMHLDMGMFMFRIGSAKVDWVHVDNLVRMLLLFEKKHMILVFICLYSLWLQ
jgi:nucleoside-diphosphate-sugar epimerase